MSRMSRAGGMVRRQTVETVTTLSVAPERGSVMLDRAATAPGGSSATPGAESASGGESAASGGESAASGRGSAALSAESAAPEGNSATGGDDGSGEPACYKHATAQALARVG
jgi:hypothetical protein